nr:MAG TPA: major tail protein [Caudoviricetes sp.]
MANWTDFSVSGVSATTPTNIMLGAGTLYKNLVYSKDSNKWTGTILGATSGGNKLSIKPEITDIEVDGVLVEAKGLKQKTGETAQIETNMVEITKDFLKSTVIGKDGTSEDSRFDVIESKALIEDSDYIENFAFVGFKADGSPILVIFDYAICTDGLETDNKNKEAAVVPATFKCVANLVEGGNTNTLPYHIYVPKASATQAAQNAVSK